MKTTETQVMPAPPRLFRALVAGFDAITNHIELILFPIVLDLFILFAPHMRINQVITGFVKWLTALPGMDAPEIAEMVDVSTEMWMIFAERYNLLTALRSYPVGIPSLVASIMPSVRPGGIAVNLDISSLGAIILYLFLFSIIGLIIGSFYYLIVAGTALEDVVRWRDTIRSLPWIGLQVILLVFIWVILLLGISVPGTFLVTLGSLGGLALGRCALLIFVGGVLWLIFPMLLSGHGIFVHRYSVIKSVKAGIRLTQMTFPTTALFLLIIIFIKQGLDMIWLVPADDSWLILLSIAGHAFVTTGLLAASFLYYRDADLWVKELLAQRSSGNSLNKEK